MKGNEWVLEIRTCGQCRHFKLTADIPLCKKKLMSVISTMQVYYKFDEGTCFELREDEVKDDKRITESNIGSPIICPGCGDHRYWKYDVTIGKYVCKCGRPLEHEEIESELNKGYDDYIREKEQKGSGL